MFTLPCIVCVYFLIKKTDENSDICAYVIPLIILGASIYYIINCNGCPQSITSFFSTILLQFIIPND